MTDSALIVFLRKPELGKVKTRLAKGIGDEKALEVYRILTEKTYQICSELNADIFPFFMPDVPENTIWDKSKAEIQNGNDLGECMLNAFEFVFNKGYDKAIIIGSDCNSLSSDLIKKAFLKLEKYDYTIGPAEDGGYYLLGMKSLCTEVFENMEWSKEDVYEKTIQKFSANSYYSLETLNDIDNLDDLIKEPELYNRVIK